MTTSLPFRLKHAVERGTLYLYATVALGNREIDEREERGERLDGIKKQKRASERARAGNHHGRLNDDDDCSSAGSQASAGTAAGPTIASLSNVTRPFLRC